MLKYLLSMFKRFFNQKITEKNSYYDSKLIMVVLVSIFIITVMNIETLVDASPTNLLSNGGFETGSPSPWAVSFNATESTATIVDGIGNGSKALKFDKTTVNWHYLQYNSISLSAGKTYKISAYMKTDQGVTTNIAYLGLYINTQWQDIVNNQTVTSEWKKVEGYYYSPINQSVHMKMGMNETKDLYIDDVSITEVANLLSNGGFETGSPSPWAVSFNATESTATIVDGIGTNGSKALKFDKTTVNWHYLQYNSISLSAGKTYKISAYMKTDQGVTTNIAYLSLYINMQWQNIVNNQTVTSEWKKVEGYYYSPINQSVHMKMGMNETKDLYIDDVSITEMDLSVNIFDDGFESGTTSDWIKSGCTMTVDTNNKNSGTSSAKIIGRTSASNYISPKGINFKVGSSYYITAYCKLETNEPNVILNGSIYRTLPTTSGWEDISTLTYIDNPYLTTSWQKITFIYKPSKNITGEIRIKPRNNDSTVFPVFYIDDFSCVETTLFININEYIKILLNNLGFNPSTNESNWEQVYTDEAIARGIIDQGEYSDFKQPINRYMMSKINKNALNELYLSNINQYIDRISDYNTIPTIYKESVLEMVSKGILVSNQDDKYFKGEDNVTKSEAIRIAKSIVDPSVRTLDFILNDPNSQQWLWNSPIELHNDNHGLLIGQGYTEDQLYNMVKDLSIDYLSVSAYGVDGEYVTYKSDILPELNNPLAGDYDTLSMWKNVAERANKKFFIYFNRNGNKQTIIHPEWKRKNAVGQDIIINGSDSLPCLYKSKSGKGYLETVMAPLLGEISKKYSPDGFWLDGGGMITDMCYCDSCIEFYKKSTGLNDIPYSSSDSGYDDYKRLQVERNDEYIKLLTNVIHSVNPSISVGINGGYLFSFSSAPFLTDYRSIPEGINIDYYTRDTVSGNVLTSARYFNNITGSDSEIPGQLMNAILPNIDPSSDSFPSSQLLLQSGALTLSRGNGWQMWAGGTSFTGSQAVRDKADYLGDFFQERQDGYGKTISANKVAVLLSTEDWEAANTGDESLDYNDGYTPQNFAIALQDAGYFVDVINSNLLVKYGQKYDVIVITNQKILSQSEINYINQLTSLGTKIILLGSALSSSENVSYFEQITGIRRNGLVAQNEIINNTNYTKQVPNCRSIEILNSPQVLCSFMSNNVFMTKKDNVFYVNLYNFADTQDACKFAKYIMWLAGIGQNVSTEGNDSRRQFVVNMRQKVNDNCIKLHITDITSKKSGIPVFPNSINNIDNEMYSVTNLNLKMAIDQCPTSITVYPTSASCTYSWSNGILDITLSGFVTYAIIDINNINSNNVDFLPAQYVLTNNFGFEDVKSLSNSVNVVTDNNLLVNEDTSIQFGIKYIPGFVHRMSVLQQRLDLYNKTFTSLNTDVVAVDNNGNVEALSVGTATVRVHMSDGNDSFDIDIQYVVN